jgi:purine-binding chemotaxis protein CheW
VKKVEADNYSELNERLKNAEGGEQYVTFSIDEDEFGIEILKVQEIIGYTKSTHVPNTPEFVSGVINLRGVIIPVIDIRKKFSMQEKEYNKYTVIIVIEVASKTMGIIVDAVSDVLSLEQKNIQNVPEFNKFHSDYIKGMGKVKEKLIILLDINKILSYDEYKRINEIG